MSPCLNFRWTFANSGGHTKSIQFSALQFNTVSGHNFRKFLFPCSLNIELDVDSFGSRRGVDDSEVVSVIVFNVRASFHG